MPTPRKLTNLSKKDLPSHQLSSRFTPRMEKHEPIGPNHSPIVQRLLQGIISHFAIERSASEDSELLGQILAEEGQQGDWRQEDIRHEGGDDGCEGRGETWRLG